MSFEPSQTNFRVDHSYENEFALAASSEVVAVVTFGLLLTSIMPDLPWALLATTTGEQSVFNPATNSTIKTFPVTYESFNLWDNSCNTEGMAFTYNAALCMARTQVVEAFATLATMFGIMAVAFGVMPFSPVAPREPKQALTHAMLCHMASGLFALIAWSTFYGGLVHGVFSTPNAVISFSPAPWKTDVNVTSGGIVSVSGWCTSFASWVLSLSAMIKYDSAAAEQAVIDHEQKKEEKRRRKAEIIQRLGEGATRAAQEGIALELGDKLYLGGTISAGATCAVAWGNNVLTPFLLQEPFALPGTAGAFMIINVLASTVGTVVLLIGLSDLVPRPKAAVGGFAVFSMVTCAWIVNFGMAVSWMDREPNRLLALEATLGTLGIGFSLTSTIVLYHPFKIWEKVMTEVPRPAKLHKGNNGMGLVNAAAICSLLAFGLNMGGLGIFLLSREEFVGPVSRSPSPAPINLSIAPSVQPSCPNGEGDLCNLGTAAERCCQVGLECLETSFTRFTCVNSDREPTLNGSRDPYNVAQAFLALSIGSSTLVFVFSSIALTPNGVMDIKVALTIVFSIALVGCSFGIITFSILQGLVLSEGGSGMPRECGYMLGAAVAEGIASVCSFFAWLPYLATPQTSSEDDLLVAERQLEIERVRLEAVKLHNERMKLQESQPKLKQGNAERSRTLSSEAGHVDDEEVDEINSQELNVA